MVLPHPPPDSGAHARRPAAFRIAGPKSRLGVPPPIKWPYFTPLRPKRHRRPDRLTDAGRSRHAAPRPFNGWELKPQYGYFCTTTVEYEYKD